MTTRPVLLAAVLGIALALSDGIALAATIRCRSNETCVGTREADVLKGTAGENTMFGRRGDDTLRGLDKRDALYGEAGSDTLSGGGDQDWLDGGAGSDTLAGGGDHHDIYHFAGNAWGRNTVVDDASPPNSIYFAPSNIDFAPVTDDLTIDLIPDPGRPEVTIANGTSVVDCSGPLLFGTVNGGEGDDTITGDNGANSIAGDLGADTIDGGGGDDHIYGAYFASGPAGAADADSIRGGGGNDEIVVMDGTGGDTVDCGEGDQDFVWADAGDNIAANCEFQTGF